MNATLKVLAALDHPVDAAYLPIPDWQRIIFGRGKLANPLFYSSPVGKGAYQGGRFLAAFALNALVLLGVQVGNLLAAHAPGIDPAIIGPFRPAAYLAAYAFIALPNAFIVAAIQFTLALLSGRPMASYLASDEAFQSMLEQSLRAFTRRVGELLDAERRATAQALAQRQLRPRQRLPGLRIARMVGHMTYLSPESLQRKFGRRRREVDLAVRPGAVGCAAGGAHGLATGRPERADGRAAARV